MDGIERIKRGLKRRLKNLVGADNGNQKKDAVKKSSQKEMSVGDRYYIELVARETGWSFSEAHKALKAAKKQYRVKYADYAKNALYKVPEDRLEEACKAAIEKRIRAKEKKEARLARRNEGYIDNVAEKTGWAGQHPGLSIPKAKVGDF